MIQDNKSPASPSLLCSKKSKINNLILKELKFHSKKIGPVNSSKSIKLLKLNFLNDEIIPKKHFKPTVKHSKNSSLDLRYSNESLGSGNSSVFKKKNSIKSPQESMNYLAHTEREIHRNENFCVKNFTKPILLKHKKFFELISQKSAKVVIEDKKVFRKHESCLKLEVEKVLHDEYIKDKAKLKVINGKPYIHKKIWKPDCVKTLKKAEKVILSLPKTRKL